MEKNTTKQESSTNTSEEHQPHPSDDLAKTIRTNLTKLLTTKGISAKTLALQTRYSEAAISKYRTGKQLPPMDFFFELKKLYNISIDDFLSKEISKNDITSHFSISPLAEEEKILYQKFCGCYLTYYLNPSSYKGRDQSSAEESLLYGVINIFEDSNSCNISDYSCIALLGINNRDYATTLRESMQTLHTGSEIEQFIYTQNNESLLRKIYYGSFEITSDHVFITLSHDRKDKALMILHRVNTNKKEYIGGLGTMNSVSKGREGMPSAQYIALTRYPISLSKEAIHHQLLLSHPTYKADRDVKALIALFKKTYMMTDPDNELHTELEKELIIKVNLERYVKESLKRNMFRYAKISERDDEAWYKLLKEVSIIDN